MSSPASPAVDAAASEAVLKPDHSAHRRHFIFTEEHDQPRESIGNFVTKELAPHAERWEEETFEDWVFPRMGELGFLGLSYPEEYGGQGGDYYANLILAEEMPKSNSGGLAMGIAVHTDMATPPVHLFGTGGCCTKPSRESWSALPERGARTTWPSDIATNSSGAADRSRNFVPHPYKGSQGLAGGLCNSHA